MSYIVQGDTGDWEVVIGLEVHAQVSSNAKLFSGSRHGLRRRAQLPGLADRRGHARHAAGDQRLCVEQAVKHRPGPERQGSTRLSVFERKNYFYPDLPQGYQISQYEHPIVGEGDRHGRSGRTARPADIGIERLHMEQDAGKSMHDQSPTKPLVDLNRAGVCADGNRLQTGHPLAGRSRCLCDASCAPSCAISAPATAIWNRAPCAADVNVSVRKPGGRGLPHAGRDQERQLRPLRHAGQSIDRGRTSGRGSSKDGGDDRSGNPPDGPQQGRDPVHAGQGIRP